MRIFIILIFLIRSFTISSQVLETEIKPDGVLYPRVTTSQRDSIGLTASEGLCVYNTDTKQLECFNGSNWNKTSWYSIPAIDFLPEVHNNIYGFTARGGAHFTNAPLTSVKIMAPVHLPHGSIVKRLIGFYRDTDKNNTVFIGLAKRPHDDLLTSSGIGYVPGDTTSFGSFSRALNDTIDNLQNLYWVEMAPVTSPGFMDDDFRIYSMIIEYQE